MIRRGDGGTGGFRQLFRRGSVDVADDDLDAFTTPKTRHPNERGGHFSRA
jgi:hypothetical protein